VDRAAGAGSWLRLRLGLAEKVREGFTAFAALSDLQALRALTELQRDGITVPDMASVTGFDDLIWSPVVTPGLTTVAMDMVTIAEIAISSLAENHTDERQPRRRARHGGDGPCADAADRSPIIGPRTRHKSTSDGEFLT
jgi:DNA-binding LacI/PurR family transcriptional regulator